MNIDWVIKIANQVEAHVRRTKGEGATIVCASGISPSGPIHLGNLRAKGGRYATDAVQNKISD